MDRFSLGRRSAVLISLTILSASSTRGQIVSKSPMPTPRMAAASAVVGNKIYVIGGLSRQGKAVATVEEYDPIKDIWTTRRSMPTARFMLAATAVGDTIYALGGRSSDVLATVETYDVGLDQWTPVASLPSGRWGLMAATLGNKLLAIGGVTGTGSRRQSVSSVDILDPLKKSWSSGRSLPAPIQNAAIVCRDGVAYLIGGRVGAGDTGVASDMIYEWNGVEDSGWTSTFHLRQKRTGVRAAIVGSNLVVVGGAADSMPLLGIEVLDFGQGKWTGVGDLPTARVGHITECVNGKIYVIGGSSEESLSSIDGQVKEVSLPGP